MIARKLSLAALMVLCALVFAAVAGVAPAVAAAPIGEAGSQAGQLSFPAGVAFDGMGDLYVSDAGNNRVDKFDASGDFALAWGEGVADDAEELQTCTSICQRGTGGNVSGGLDIPAGIAVDDELSSLSYGDVYVADRYHGRVEKYDSTGKFLLMFGGHVNKTTGGDVCAAGETCQEGLTGAGDGEFSFWPSFGSLIAVGPGGAVYVGDQARVQVFAPTGVWKENVSLAGLSISGVPRALAVDSAGDVYVADEGVSGVREFEPGGTEKGVQLDSGSTSVTALALDASGDVFVGDSGGGFHVLEYDSTGKELENFRANTIVGAGQGLGANNGLALSETTKQLYASATEQNKVWALPLPPAGPMIDSESAVPGLRGTAALEGTVDPEGNETTYHFEYVDEAHYQSSGFANATSTASVSVITGLFEDHAATVALTGLAPGGIYHYRLVARDSLGHTTNGPDQSFEPTPPALIEDVAATNVAATSVTLSAQINPLGASTSYRLEYGPTLGYGHVLSGNVGEGMGLVQVVWHIQELEPGTLYHYRFVTENEVGKVEGAVHTLTTQATGGQAFVSADGRAWELVSPPDKKGALIEPFTVSGLTQAAVDGSGISYLTAGTHVGQNPAGKITWSQVLSTRGPGGWRSEDVSLPETLPPEGESALNMSLVSPEYRMFSPDLSLAAVEPQFYDTPPLSPEATERTLYRRDDASGSYTPLVTPADVPSGTKFGGNGESEQEMMSFRAATPDLSHVVLESPQALTSDAISTPLATCSNAECEGNLYEWSDGELHLVNILPNGEPTDGLAYVGGEGFANFGSAPRVVSNDGRRVVWTWSYPYGNEPRASGGPYGGLYIRDMVEEKTVRVGGPRAVFQTMSSDGSRIFFLENGDLHEFDADTGTQMDLTSSHGVGESRAGVKESVSDVSEDGSYAYFVATGVLANGAVGGADNLYVLHDDGSGWSTTYIATLSSEDEKDWGQAASRNGPELSKVDSRVSPDGRYLAFMSNRSLTGYDNVDAVSGQPDEEVYLYGAAGGRLVCASCNPTGARPVGVLDSVENGGRESLLVDREKSWALSGEGSDHWLAGSVPGWDLLPGKKGLYQPRYLSDGGRLFFDSPDALVAQATNGLEDVYEYEPSGLGSCAGTSATFSERSNGCVNLISSGISNTESVFYDASEDGNDVFFITASKLVPEDYDAAYDVYDAHVCTITVPCSTAPVASPPCTSGDSCKAAPSPQPEIFGSAPSATFSGTGNVVEEAKKGAVKRKVKPKKKKKHARHKKKKAKGKRAKRSHAARSSRMGGKR